MTVLIVVSSGSEIRRNLLTLLVWATNQLEIPLLLNCPRR